MPQEDDGPDARPTRVQLIIKSPSNSLETDALRLTVPLEGTVRTIKEALQQAHPEHPPPSTQRLIFAGRLLQDATPTADVLRQVRAPPTPLTSAYAPRAPTLTVCPARHFILAARCARGADERSRYRGPICCSPAAGRYGALLRGHRTEHGAAVRDERVSACVPLGPG